MFTSLIKYYFIFLFTIYLAQKLLNYQPKSKTHYLVVLLTAPLILSFPTLLLFSYQTRIFYLIPLLMLWSYMTFKTNSPQISFIVTVLSFGISFCAHCFAALISTSTIYLLTKSKTSISFLAISILSTFIHSIICFVLSRHKRFKKGLPMINFNNYINTITIICLFFMFLPIYFPADMNIFAPKLFALILTILTLAFLIFWWQAQITKTYRYRLLMRELESRRTSEAEKDALIEKLYAENDRLARITHRDNSLITALKDAAVKGLRTDFENSEEMIATREKLIANIEKLAEGRSSISPDYNKKTAREFDTGLSLLDDLLHHMDNNAMEQDIMFSVHFGITLKDFVPQNISESDLVHTVDDLLKNAFKSTRTCESRIVQLQFYKLGKHLVIEVADSGIPFEIRSLVNMGIEKLTTYEDGSGIGLMDIFHTKEKYRATYHLDEYAAPSPFSKKISLTFDKKNRYTIRTYRKNEILQISRRADLQVYDDNE